MSTSARLGFLALALTANLLVASDAQAQSYKILHFFTGYENGSLPADSPTLDAAGNLYGTSEGGYFGCGNVFKFSPKPDGTWIETVLTTFCGGADGAAGDGRGYHVKPESDGRCTETVLLSFQRGAGGDCSAGSRTVDAAKNDLYGTTSGGGANAQCSGCGMVFQLQRNQDWKES